jgi:seryl-tRNA synthetase
MLDIKFICENKREVKANLKRRGADPEKCDIDAIVKYYKMRRKIRQESESINRERKLAAKGRLFEKGRKLKAEGQKLETRLRALDNLISKHLRWVPNMLHPSVPDGKTDKDNKEIKKVGKLPKFDFKVEDHEELGVFLLLPAKMLFLAQGIFLFLKKIPTN